MVEIKFCGLTRPDDARQAAALGARYVGVIFADSARKLTDDAARKVLGAVPDDVARVGVFGDATPAQIAERASRLALDVVQLHSDPTARTIAGVRQRWDGQVWAVQRVDGARIPDSIVELFEAADGVVLDARVAGQLGGTGVTLPWAAIHERVSELRARGTRLVLAGGLNPANVSRAIEALEPDVVDVSSGVESGVGVKDHSRMRAFRDAVALR